MDLKKLTRTHTREAVAALVEIANDRKAKNADRIVAANSLLDRGHGRPHQSVDLGIELQKKLSNMSLDELRAFREKYVAAMATTPMLIEATADTTIIPEYKAS